MTFNPGELRMTRMHAKNQGHATESVGSTAEVEMDRRTLPANEVGNDNDKLVQYW